MRNKVILNFIISMAAAAAINICFIVPASALITSESGSAVIENAAARGTAVSVPGLTFTSPSCADEGIDGKRTTVDAEYIIIDENTGGYSLTPRTGRYLVSKNSFALKPNRNYLISVLINCKYDRSDCEVSMGFEEFDKDGSNVLRSYIGTPAETDGWYRFEGTVTTSSRTVCGKFSLSLYGFNIPDSENQFCISDLNILELPAEELTLSEPGEGMVFGGSSGMYDMRVKSVNAFPDIITVKTTGAEYIFDKNADTVAAFQLINGKRQLFTAEFGKSLSGLTLVSQSDSEAVLTTGESGLTIGVQMDSLMLISNHGNTDLDITCVSAISGRWNRLCQGNLMAKDDSGGFTVNPHIPMGTGRLARYSPGSTVDFDGVVNDTCFVSSAKPGWNVDYTISDGELLGMSVFPAREYDWKGSFENTYTNYYMQGSDSRFAEDAVLYGIDVAVLWNFTQRGWGMSFGNKYLPVNESVYKNNIDCAHEAGLKAAAYMSMYYWHNRDVDEYIGEVKRHRDTYGIDGVYSDGLPDKEWLAAYEGARKLRELFPNGVLIFHTTGQAGNGGPPLAVPDISIPAIDAYSTMTLRGEGVSGEGLEWEYPKNITSGYNTSNSIGILKGDAWLQDGELIPREKQNLINLLYNGRARMEVRDSHMEKYSKLLHRLKVNHAFSGDRQDYYNSFYLPYVHRLIRDDVELNGEHILACEFNSSDELSDWNKEGTADFAVTDVDGENVLCVSGSGNISYAFGESVGILNLSFDVMADSPSGGEVFVTDSDGKKLFGVSVIDSQLRYYGRIGGYRSIAGCALGQWHKISIQADSSTKSFNVYADGELVAKRAYFAYGTGLPYAVHLASGKNAAGNVYYDNVMVDLEF